MFIHTIITREMEEQRIDSEIASLELAMQILSKKIGELKKEKDRITQVTDKQNKKQKIQEEQQLYGKYILILISTNFSLSIAKGSHKLIVKLYDALNNNEFGHRDSEAMCQKIGVFDSELLIKGNCVYLKTHKIHNVVSEMISKVGKNEIDNLTDNFEMKLETKSDYFDNVDALTQYTNGREKWYLTIGLELETK